jgi:CheY-like chemotaxis protein
MARIDMDVSFPGDGGPGQSTDARAVAVWRLGSDGLVQATNPVAGQNGARIGESWRDGWPEQARAAIDEALETARRGDTAALRVQAGEVQFEVVVTPLLVSGGVPEGFSASARPVTAELEAADVLADFGHELRTPLHGLLAGASILEAHPLAQAERELAGMMRAAALALAVRLRIPLDWAAAAPIAEPSRRAVPGAKLQILVADDHPTNRRVAELILGDFACVRTVNDGREAIEAFAQQPFDLVLMDIQMPVLDGVSAVSAIRRWEALNNRPRTPIAMLTANTDPANVAASRAAGADQHIAKPFTPNHLVSCVQELLHARAA